MFKTVSISQSNSEYFTYSTPGTSLCGPLHSSISLHGVINNLQLSCHFLQVLFHGQRFAYSGAEVIFHSVIIGHFCSTILPFSTQHPQPALRYVCGCLYLDNPLPFVDFFSSPKSIVKLLFPLFKFKTVTAMCTFSSIPPGTVSLCMAKGLCYMLRSLACGSIFHVDEWSVSEKYSAEAIGLVMQTSVERKKKLGGSKRELMGALLGRRICPLTVQTGSKAYDLLGK